MLLEKACLGKFLMNVILVWVQTLLKNFFKKDSFKLRGSRHHYPLQSKQLCIATTALSSLSLPACHVPRERGRVSWTSLNVASEGPPRNGEKFRDPSQENSESPGSFLELACPPARRRHRRRRQPPLSPFLPSFPASFLLTFYRNIVTVSSVFVVAFSLFLWPVF